MNISDKIEPCELTESSSEELQDPRTRPHRNLATLRAADWWMWEIVSLVVSAASLITIVVLLSSLDNKPQPTWAAAGTHCSSAPGSVNVACRLNGISVNSVVSWLGTLARLCLLVPLANGLGQSRWSWFAEKERPLADMNAFDAATRGLSGSLQLIWKLKACYFATLCALGIVLSVAFDPFVQNLVGYYTKNVVDPAQTALISNNSYYGEMSYPSSGDQYAWADPVLKSNVFNALHSTNQRQFWAEPHHVCSTGQCIWPPTPSIGMCTTCEDITAMVKETCYPHQYGEYSNPCNLTVITGVSYLDPFILSYSIKNGSFGSQILGKFFTITSTSGKGNINPRQIFSIYLDVDRQDALQGRIFPSQVYPKFRASKCTIEHCVQSTRSFYSLSDPTAASPYREETLKIWTAEASSIRNLGYQVIVPAEPEYGLYGQNFSIDGYTMESILMFIGDTFQGYYSKGGSLGNSFQKPGKQTAGPDEVILALWTSNFTNCAYPSNRISCALDLVSKAMSKTFRDWPYTINGTQGTQGEAYSPVIHIRVSWVWITLPACTWLLALVTFVSTAWRSRVLGMHVWWNSTLLIVFMRLDGEVEGVGDEGVEMKALQRRARAMRGKVDVDQGDVRFVF